MKNLTRQVLLIFFVICISSVLTIAQKKPKCCINGGIVNGKAKTLPMPEYPANLKFTPKNKVVKVRAIIDLFSGKVISVKAFSGSRVLWKSAEDAAKLATFSPFTPSGEPVLAKGTIVYKFVAPKSENRNFTFCTGGVLNGKAINFVQPEYPKNKTRASGQVSVQVVVDESGNVSSAIACSGNYLLRKPAIEAAKRLKFPQTMLSGVPVKVSAAVVYNFVPPNSRKKVSKFPPCPSGANVIKVINGRAVNLVQPEYPEEARKARVVGQVAVQALVDENGKVISAAAVWGNPLLRSAAVEAARKSTFKPRVDCHSNFVKISGTVIYNFVAQ